MKYIDYQERAQQGTFNFPIAFYHQTPHSPRYDMQYHWHTQYEIIRIISGTFQLKLEKSTMLCQAGDVIFITSGMLHGGTPHDCVYECIVFDLQILLKNNHACSRIIRDIIDQKITVNTRLSETSETVPAIVHDLCHALSSKKTGYEFMVQGYLYHLLGTIIHEHLYEQAHQNIISAERISSVKNVLTFSYKLRCSFAVSEEVGSSRISTLQFAETAFAISTICICAMLRAPSFAWGLISSFSFFSSSSVSLYILA